MVEKNITTKSGKTYRLRSLSWTKRNDILIKVSKPGGKAGLPSVDKVAYNNELLKAIVVDPPLDIRDGVLCDSNGELDISEGDELWESALDLMGMTKQNLNFLLKLSAQNDTQPQ
jgi:hypothetical protein